MAIGAWMIYRGYTLNDVEQRLGNQKKYIMIAWELYENYRLSLTDSLV